MNTNRFQVITPTDLDDYDSHADRIAEASWPEFMLHDSVANQNWHDLFDRFNEYQFAMWDTESNRMAAMGNSVPFHWDKDLSELPEGGWDWVFLQAIENHKNGTTPNIQSAIQIAIHPDYQSQGIKHKDGESHARHRGIPRLQESRRAGATEPEEQISAREH